MLFSEARLPFFRSLASIFSTVSAYSTALTFASSRNRSSSLFKEFCVFLGPTKTTLFSGQRRFSLAACRAEYVRETYLRSMSKSSSSLGVANFSSGFGHCSKFTDSCDFLSRVLLTCWYMASHRNGVIGLSSKFKVLSVCQRVAYIVSRRFLVSWSSLQSSWRTMGTYWRLRKLTTKSSSSDRAKLNSQLSNLSVTRFMVVCSFESSQRSGWFKVLFASAHSSVCSCGLNLSYSAFCRKKR